MNGLCTQCTSPLCRCVEDHYDDTPTVRVFKRLAREQVAERELRPCPLVHYGRVHLPDQHADVVVLRTVPREGETLLDVLRDRVRALWPSR